MNLNTDPSEKKREEGRERVGDKRTNERQGRRNRLTHAQTHMMW